MKVTKRIIHGALALLPLLGVLLLFVTSFNAKTETYPYHSRVRFTYSVGDGTGWFQFDEPTATNAKIIGAMYSTRYNLNATAPTHAEALEGSMLVLARLADKLREVTGIPLTYIAIPLWYVFYLFIIELMFMIANIITFIPRKCGEFLGG